MSQVLHLCFAGAYHAVAGSSQQYLAVHPISECGGPQWDQQDANVIRILLGRQTLYEEERAAEGAANGTLPTDAQLTGPPVEAFKQCMGRLQAGIRVKHYAEMTVTAEAATTAINPVRTCDGEGERQPPVNRIKGKTAATKAVK